MCIHGSLVSITILNKIMQCNKEICTKNLLLLLMNMTKYIGC
jgi:hypothetical protein